MPQVLATVYQCGGQFGIETIGIAIVTWHIPLLAEHLDGTSLTATITAAASGFSASGGPFEVTASGALTLRPSVDVALMGVGAGGASPAGPAGGGSGGGGGGSSGSPPSGEPSTGTPSPTLPSTSTRAAGGLRPSAAPALAASTITFATATTLATVAGVVLVVGAVLALVVARRQRATATGDPGDAAGQAGAGGVPQ